MKRFIKDTLLLLFISAILFLTLYFVNKYVFGSNLLHALNYGLGFTFYLFSITYKRLWGEKTNQRKLILSIILTIGLSSFFINAFEQTIYIYKHFNCNISKRGWKGTPHKADKILGFATIPNSRAFHTFPIGEDIPMAYDNMGFRIPVSDTLAINNYDSLDLLFLGCSFTYGDANIAEHTYPYLVSKETQLSYANSGVCSYGLAHMVLLAERYVPQFKPKYIVLQHSPWLINRGCSMYAPVYYGTLPNPFFTDKGSSFSIHPPVFETLIFSLNQKSKLGELFLIVIKNDFRAIKTYFDLLFNKVPKPTQNKDSAELFAYNQIIEIARKEGTKVIIVKLFNRQKDFYLKDKIIADNVLFANADTLLFHPTKSDEYYKKNYGHWRLHNGDSVFVDGHPNQFCHEIISKSIIQVLNEE